MSSDSISLNCKNIKWESRLNYKIKPDMCSKLRNYDNVSEFDMATIDFWQCIEDSNEYILRCTVRTPNTAATRKSRFAASIEHSTKSI